MSNNTPTLSAVFTQSISDFFSKPILLKLLSVIFVSVLLVYISGFYLFDYLFTLSGEIQQGTYSAESVSASIHTNIEGIPVIGAALAFIVANFVLLVLTVASVFIGSYVTMIFSLIIAGLLTPSIIKIIIVKRGGSQADIKGFGNLLTGIGKVILIGILHLLLFLLMLPLMFIPLINLFLFTAILYSFFRYILIYDVGSNMLDIEDFKANTGFFNKDLFILTITGFFLSSLPVIGIFSSVFTVIMLINYFYEDTQHSPI
jgi:hypothetical protein